MPWFKVDDKLHDHPKAIRAGLEAMGLWTAAGSYAADNLTDGFVPERVLPRWTTRARGLRLAAKLVDVGLWVPDEQGGETGWRFHEWEERQPTRERVVATRKARAEAGRVGGLASGRTRRGEANPEQVALPLLEPPSRPVPSRPDEVVSQSPQGESAGLTDDEIARVAGRLDSTKGHARKVAAQVLARARGQIADPLRYVLRAIDAEPARYEPTRANRQKQRDCPDHAGQPADNCGGCAADRLAGDA